MNFPDFINRADNMLRNSVEQGYNYKELILSRIAKLTEEVGELSHAMLHSIGHQQKRADRSLTVDSETLGGEIADVIIVAHLIGKAYDIDVEQALQKKMEKVKGR